MSVNENKSVDDYTKDFSALSKEEVEAKLAEVVGQINTYSSYLEPLEAQLVALLDVADDNGYDVSDTIDDLHEDSDPA